MQPDGGNVGHEARLSKLIRTPPSCGKAGVLGSEELSAGVPVNQTGPACMSSGIARNNGMYISGLIVKVVSSVSFMRLAAVCFTYITIGCQINDWKV